MREYRNFIADNRRWAGFEPKADDIFVCSPPKCGTTWVQTIIASLLWPDGNAPGPVMTISPWIEAKLRPADDMYEMLAAQSHRRFMKSHTPADGIPWYDDAKYVFVGRDGRDAFMSLCNHVERMRAYDDLTAAAEAEGLEALRYDGDVHAFFVEWLADGDTFFNLVATYWSRRSQRNVIFVHYNDLKADLEGEMRRLAEFLDIEVPMRSWPVVVERCTFESMRARDREIGGFDKIFEGGIESFLFKGTTGRWRDVLTAEELAAYERRLADFLPREAGVWLENGRKCE